MRTFLCIPTYDGNVHHHVMGAVLNTSDRVRNCDYAVRSSSFLTYNFNMLWCIALNKPQYSHFVMLHADIAPLVPNWISKLIGYADSCGADIMSAVSPIKMPEGYTSTALAKIDEPFGNYRRLVMREAMQLPECFDRKPVANLFGVDWKDHWLLTNTGMMVVNLKKRDVLSKMCFTVNNWIRQKPNGEYYAVSEPEDWAFSREAQERGLSVWATRGVPMAHVAGNNSFSGNEAWGTLEHDEVNK